MAAEEMVEIDDGSPETPAPVAPAAPAAAPAPAPEPEPDPYDLSALEAALTEEETTPTGDEATPPAAGEKPADEADDAGEAIQEKDGQLTIEPPEETAPELDWPADLLQQAKGMGFTEEEAKTFGDPLLLQDALTVMDRNLVGSRPVEPPAPAPAPAPVAPPPPAAPAPASLPADLSATLAKLDAITADEHGAEVAAAMQAVKAVMGSVLELNQGLNNRVTTLQTEAQQRRNDTFATEFDAALSELGDEYEPTFGKGAGSELDSTSTEMQHRMKLINGMELIAARLQQQGQRVPPIKQLLARAVRMDFPEPADTTARQKIAKQLAKRGRNILARPEGAKADDGPSDAKAIRALKTLLKDDDDATETELGELLSIEG